VPGQRRTDRRLRSPPGSRGGGPAPGPGRRPPGAGRAPGGLHPCLRRAGDQRLHRSQPVSGRSEDRAMPDNPRPDLDTWRKYARAYAEEEARFDTPAGTELTSVTVRLVAPTVATFGTAGQKARFLRPLRRAELLACQLFSEPGAGSDLANLACRVERDGDEWIVNGQKVWTSGAPHAAYGELIARTDPGAPKHQGLTAFLVPLDAPGVEIRPIRQMTGGASF